MPLFLQRSSSQVLVAEKKSQYSVILSHNLNESVAVVYSVEANISCFMRLPFSETVHIL